MERKKLVPKGRDQVKDDMRDWTLPRIVWVADRGFSSEHNRRYLRQGDHAYSHPEDAEAPSCRLDSRS